LETGETLTAEEKLQGKMGQIGEDEEEEYDEEEDGDDDEDKQGSNN
jgi:hypothetical protein